MIKKLVTWLGEDDLHFRITDDGKQEPVPGPSYTTWRHDDVFIKFEKNVGVIITDDPTFAPTLALRQQILRKVDGMPSRFKVETVVDGEEPETKDVKGEKPDFTVEKTLKQQNRPDDPPPELPELPEPPPQNGGKKAAMPAPLTPPPMPKGKAKEKA